MNENGIVKSFVGEELYIVKDGVTNYKVFLYPGAGKVGSFAKSELKKYVNRISGAELSDTGSIDQKTIVLGLRSEIFGIPECRKGYDGYTIIISRSGIVICGENPRGLLYGVYDILEKWGCRFYLPQLDPIDCETIIKSPDIKAKIELRSEASPMEFRIINVGSFLFEFKRDNVLAQIDWVAKNRYNGISWQPGHRKGELYSEIQKLSDWGGIEMMEERGLFLHGPGHSLYHFLPADQYFDEHPEYFGMINGKRSDSLLVNFCWSNEEAVRICHDNIINFIRKWPIFKVLYLVANDGGMVCSCPKCTQIGGASLISNFFNVLSDRIEKELPGLYLESVIAYGPMADIPYNCKPNGKWGGLYAHWGKDHTTAYGDKNYSNYADLYVWSNSKYFEGKLEICSYYTSNSMQPYVGVPYLYALEADMDYMASNSIKGSLILNYPFGTWWSIAFNNFMGGRIAYYYPYLKPVDALEDFCMIYFGEKAGPVMLEQKLLMAENLKRFQKFTNGDGDRWDISWLKYFQKMNNLALDLTDGIQPYAYRVEKSIALFNHQIMWADSMERLARCKSAVENAISGTLSKEEALKAIEIEKGAMDELDSYGHEIEKSYPGTMDADWFRSWNMNRLFYGPLQDLMKKLDSI